jgi:hypothetical protein
MSGIFVGAHLTSFSTVLIRNYASMLNLPKECKILPPKELHFSIMYCKTNAATDLTWKNYPKDSTVTTATAYKLVYIGKALAIIAESHWLRKRFNFARVCGLRSDFPGFIPHCSICYDPPTNLPIAFYPQPWRMPIELTGEYTEELKDK